MEIAVHPDGSVVVKAPVGTSPAAIQARVLKRAGWIRRQRDYFRHFEPRTPPRRYVGGETHLYLGRRYRLKIARGGANDVKLVGRYFRITVRGRISSNKVKDLLEKWYAEKAEIRFRESLARCWPPFEKRLSHPPKVHTRRMQTRWGSLSKKGSLTLNPDLIRASKSCIDYVITHELCHMKWHDHGPDFHRLLRKIMPDWEKRKRELEATTR
jgi:predicted metal-dependent hydrolase